MSSAKFAMIGKREYPNGRENPPVIRRLIATLLEGRNLTATEAAAAMNEIMEGTATPSQVAAFLISLRLKGETTSELTGLAGVMREKAVRLRTPLAPVDTCGTGGDGHGTFNISTAAALVVAGAGQPVAKHGNRAISSSCGSADVLEALGARITLGPDEAARCLAQTGLTFMFAQLYHPAMRFAAPVRRDLGVATVFNILGPLTNPARTPYQVVGVARPELLRRMAEALGRLGSRRALVVHGAGGIDELSLAGPNLVCEWTGRHVVEYRLDAVDFGLGRAPISAIKGAGASENVAIMRAVLGGEPGPARETVLFNAAAALYVSGRAPAISEAVTQAAASIDSGRARRALDRFVSLTQTLEAKPIGAQSVVDSI